MSTVRILFDLREGMGLGDSVQSCILWKHLKRYRPNWVIDVRCRDGLASCFRPFVSAVFDNHVSSLTEYDQIVALNWNDVFETFPDRPSTKVAYCLKNVFGIERYDADLGRYEVEWSCQDGDNAAHVVSRFKHGVVATNFVGDSYSEKKNLTVDDQAAIVEGIGEIGFTALPSDGYHLGGANGLGAFISQSFAFIGIDSGPGKIASATVAPTLICWTGHHPLRYHDPAPNTTHLIPERWGDLPPFDVMADSLPMYRAAVDYFKTNYVYRIYRPGELAKEACAWLREVLK